ncbi:phage tail protein [Aurantiacibacter marinus]|uniref:Uncharacterized protein n=1 Tax=Aurantiacibacter marinus TaxID=874156 RepID=A0A0H0XSA1_9SPHN|nr:phage tail protein [Aurantiacibacter marinus]KLI64851.1 hypothetical protein AAV99_04920 [Aurantiacibacter marinus]
MATLILSAAGTAIAGPIGGSIGSLIGSQIDASLFGPPDREGPRLSELKVTTSSYGAPISRHFGRMRAAGTIIWATDLKENKEKTSGGKGSPSTTTFSYSSSFAVALASRPIASLGRIWADGNLLRGAAGDLKVGGQMRLYTGRGDQQPDPLIASAEGNEAPGFRGFAYCVFEELQLADFGNRIPALTFEVVADNGDVSLTELVVPAAADVTIGRALPALEGYSDDGGSLVEILASIDRLYPLASNAGNDRLVLGDGDPSGAPIATLPEAIVDGQGDSFGGASGKAQRTRADETNIPAGLRYYDVGRDFQAGLQRAGGRASPGRNRIIEFPGALQAANAKSLADNAAARARWSQDRLAYRIAQIDPLIAPGDVVALPGKPGKWRIEAWEWRENGLELELMRLPQRKGIPSPTAAGRSLTQPDNIATPTLLEAFELPWDGVGVSDQRQVYVAASSSSSGWTGAALYAESGGSLSPIGVTGTQRSVIGTTLQPLPAMPAVLIDRHSRLVVGLGSVDQMLESRSIEDLAQGANRALVGHEIIQFGDATHLGDSNWQLSTLIRGRGGSEHEAMLGSPAGSRFVLLDDAPLVFNNAQLGQAAAIAAIGIADADPVTSEIAGSGTALRPLTPVHPGIARQSDGSLLLSWTRRSRGAWTWAGTVEVPLNEQTEAYEVGLGDADAPALSWQTSSPSLAFDPATMSRLQSAHSGAVIWVRQIGTFARSHPLFLTIIS